MERKLSQEQRDFIASLFTPEALEQQRLLDERNRLDAEAAKKKRDEDEAKWREAQRIRAEAREAKIKPLEDALRAAGIKLSTSSCGCCGGTYIDYELPDGTKVEDMDTDLDTFGDD